MIKITRAILLFICLSSAVFAKQADHKINDEISFDAAHLNGNFTRINLQKYDSIHFYSPAECHMALAIVGTKDTAYLKPDQVYIVNMDATLSTKEILDQLPNDKTFGEFVGIENDFSYPIPGCAYDVKFTFKHQAIAKPFMGIFKVNAQQ